LALFVLDANTEKNRLALLLKYSDFHKAV